MERDADTSMTRTRTADELDSLLGRGNMGATRRDAILSTLLARAQAERRTRSRRRWSFAGLATLAAAAAGAVLLVPRFTARPEAHFRAKGGAEVPSMPSVAIECLGGSLAACPTGARLVVSAAGVRGFVSAWAEPTGVGERIWYFSADTVSPAVEAAGAAPAVRAVKIGPEHVPGTYQVEVRVTERPMIRADLLRLSDGAWLAKGQFSLTVTSP
jgi:hypothetical protein